jgi:thioester reductase-like protein
MRISRPETTLFTGATGFLGHYILRDLLLKGERIVALIRQPLDESRARLQVMLRDIGLEMERYVADGHLILTPGSLPEDLPEPDWGRTDAILNCAASLSLFSNGNGEPFTTNARGTEALTDWAIRHNVIRIYAVSTAYTCGWKTGSIPERFHSPAPDFQTDYERSKWQAEAILEEWSSWIGHSLTVFRPSFLVGDSTTGHTTQFAGFYQFARLVGALKTRFESRNNGKTTYIPLRIPGRPEDRQNLVPVDFVSKMVAEVVTRPEFHGRIYHLTNPEPPTNDMMKQCYEEFFGLHGGSFADPQEVVGKCSTAESLLWDQYSIVTPRVFHNPQFTMDNTKEVMEQAGVTFPSLHPERILMLFDYAAQKGWGRGTNGFHH